MCCADVCGAVRPGAYQRSLVKAAVRTLEEGRFPFAVVDAPNILVDDLKDLWAATQVCVCVCVCLF